MCNSYHSSSRGYSLTKDFAFTNEPWYKCVRVLSFFHYFHQLFARFQHGFGSQRKGSPMNGNSALGTNGIFHANRFLDIDVIGFRKRPWLVCSNWNGGTIKRSVALPKNATHVIKPRRVATKQEFLALFVAAAPAAVVVVVGGGGTSSFNAISTPQCLVSISNAVRPMSDGDAGNDDERLVLVLVFLLIVVVVLVVMDKLFVPIQLA